MLTDFHLSGISIGVDAAIIFVAWKLFNARKEDIKKEKKERIESNTEAIFADLMAADKLIDDLFKSIHAQAPFEHLVKIHEQIWCLLKKLKLTAAIKGTPELYNAIDENTGHYRTAMEDKSDPILGIYSLALLLVDIMQGLQESKEVIDDYIKDRFTLTPEEIRKEVQAKLNN